MKERMVYMVTKNRETLAVYDTYAKAEELYKFLKREALREALNAFELDFANGEPSREAQIKVLEAHTNSTTLGYEGHDPIYDIKSIIVNDDNELIK